MRIPRRGSDEDCTEKSWGQARLGDGGGRWAARYTGKVIEDRTTREIVLNTGEAVIGDTGIEVAVKAIWARRV